MGTYKVIEATGEGLVKLLRKELVPEFVEHEEEIDLCCPDEKGDAIVSICLYDISQSEEMAGVGMQNRGLTRQKYPSLFLNLHYMITVHVQSDRKFRARQEQKLMGRILQIFAASRILAEEYLLEGVPENPVKIQMEKLSFDEKTKIYSGMGKPYQNSLFYRVFPVELESTEEKKVHRVTHMDFSVKEEKMR